MVSAPRAFSGLARTSGVGKVVLAALLRVGPVITKGRLEEVRMRGQVRSGASSRALLLIGLLALALSSGGQQRAVRNDGATVILHPDGRWEVVPPAAASAAAASVSTRESD